MINSRLTAPLSLLVLCGGLLAFRQINQLMGGGGRLLMPRAAIDHMDQLANEALQVVYRGRDAMRQGNYVQAETLFHQALNMKEAPRADAWIALAELYERQGRIGDSANAYHALVFPPRGRSSSIGSDPTTQMRYAIVLTEVNKWAEAVQVYEHALSLTPQSGPQPRINVHFRKDVPEQAKLQAMAHIVLGFMQPSYAQRDPEEELDHFARAAQLEPNMALAQYFHGHGLEVCRRFSEASAAYKKAVTLAPVGSTLREEARAADRHSQLKLLSVPVRKSNPAQH